ncbi:centromere protein O isoform X1 [Telopea speciosissima]|uniref:centromere protein O isoform X1 n=1 Tax=Telopea speciosissima TaxID=54955 RepID=UPI001CC51BFD|nr:centromere protein O isoform X1 [Telopea speciosissima]
MESDMDESSMKKMSRKRPVPGESVRKQVELFKGRPYSVKGGEVNFIQEEDMRLESTRARLGNVLKRHEELKERLSRDSDRMIFERLQKEFEAARAAQTEEICLDGEQWNDGLLATIRERVHMEADRKAMPGEASMLLDPHFQGKTTYRAGTKVICCLEGARIGIQYETYFAGEPCELYHCVLESKSFLEKMTVIEHTVPFFLPIREAENDLLSSNAMKFIDYVGELLQAYVDRREQVRLIKELYGNQIRDLYHTLSYHIIEFLLDDNDCRVTVSVRYADLVSVLPTRVRVLAWPVHPSKKISTAATMTSIPAQQLPPTQTTMNRKGVGMLGSQSGPARLSYAEDALRTMSLPEAYAEIVLNLPQAVQQIFPHTGST